MVFVKYSHRWQPLLFRRRSFPMFNKQLMQTTRDGWQTTGEPLLFTCTTIDLHEPTDNNFPSEIFRIIKIRNPFEAVFHSSNCDKYNLTWWLRMKPEVFQLKSSSVSAMIPFSISHILVSFNFSQFNVAEVIRCHPFFFFFRHPPPMSTFTSFTLNLWFLVPRVSSSHQRHDEKSQMSLRCSTKKTKRKMKNVMCFSNV